MNKPELIYCAGGNRRFAEIAIKHGFSYGAQLPATTYFPVCFADQNWKDPRRRDYMQAIKKHQPRLCTVLDLERPCQYDAVIGWMIEAYWYTKVNLEAMIVIPKYTGAIFQVMNDPRVKHIPIRLGYSVPTRFGKTDVPISEFSGHEVHLLGGSPLAQFALAKQMNVKSVDGNYIQKMAIWNQVFTAIAVKAKNKHFPLLKDMGMGFIQRDAPYIAFDLSCQNLRSMWN